MRAAAIAIVAVGVAATLVAPHELLAERAPEAEMRRVCENWLSYMVHQRGGWAGETHPRVVEVHELVQGDTVLAHCFFIEPSGYVAVPVLKELPPIKAYSEKYRIDVNQEVGFPQLLREVLLDRMRLFTEIYGSPDATQPAEGNVLLDRSHREQWDRFLVDREQFASDLRGGAFAPLTEVGPLLTTVWHQRGPYNNYCPRGDSTCGMCPGGGFAASRTLVGCVATAAAQVMRYHGWPICGSGDHTYNWDGDDSCDGPVGAGPLFADFSDLYDWSNMPDSCNGGCTSQEEDALAELCYEVGVAYEMDYGVCGSGAYTDDALTVFPQYFRYDSSINKKNRDDYNADSWFDLIKEEINASRPVLYRIYAHAIVCDGWRDTGGDNQYHMNYGWAGSYTGWYTVDNLHCDWAGCDPMVEYLIRDIKPKIWVVQPDGNGEFPTIQDAIDALEDCDIIELTDGTFAGDGNWDLDYDGKALTIRSQSGNPQACIIDCDDGGAARKAFHFHAGEGPRSILEGITIKNGSGWYGGAIFCNGSSPTIRNCSFVENTSDNDGGAIYCMEASPSILGCTFSGNSCEQGGAIYCRDNSSPFISHCTISDNHAVWYGGGICSWYSSPTIDSCTISANSADSALGGGVFCWRSENRPTPVVTSCVIYGNYAGSAGGGLDFGYCSPTILGCTISGDSAAWNGGGIAVHDSCTVTVENTIIWDNAAGTGSGSEIYLHEFSTLSFYCCDIDPLGIDAPPLNITWHAPNLALDPMFCEAPIGDYTISRFSPCASDNSPPECGQIGALGVGCEYTPVEEAEAAEPARFSLAPGVPNPFNPSTVIAYTIPAGAGTSPVVLGVYNALGQRVCTLVDARQPSGTYTVAWHGTNSSGTPVASGVYFCHLRWNGKAQTQRIVLLK